MSDYFDDGPDFDPFSPNFGANVAAAVQAGTAQAMAQLAPMLQPLKEEAEWRRAERFNAQATAQVNEILDGLEAEGMDFDRDAVLAYANELAVGVFEQIGPSADAAEATLRVAAETFADTPDPEDLLLEEVAADAQALTNDYIRQPGLDELALANRITAAEGAVAQTLPQLGIGKSDVATATTEEALLIARSADAKDELAIAATFNPFVASDSDSSEGSDTDVASS